MLKNFHFFILMLLFCSPSRLENTLLMQYENECKTQYSSSSMCQLRCTMKKARLIDADGDLYQRGLHFYYPQISYEQETNIMKKCYPIKVVSCMKAQQLMSCVQENFDASKQKLPVFNQWPALHTNPIIWKPILVTIPQDTIAPEEDSIEDFSIEHTGDDLSSTVSISDSKGKNTSTDDEFIENQTTEVNKGLTALEPTENKRMENKIDSTEQASTVKGPIEVENESTGSKIEFTEPTTHKFIKNEPFEEGEGSTPHKSIANESTVNENKSTEVNNENEQLTKHESTTNEAIEDENESNESKNDSTEGENESTKQKSNVNSFREVKNKPIEDDTEEDENETAEVENESSKEESAEVESESTELTIHKSAENEYIDDENEYNESENESKEDENESTKVKSTEEVEYENESTEDESEEDTSDEDKSVSTMDEPIENEDVTSELKHESTEDEYEQSVDEETIVGNPLKDYTIQNYGVKRTTETTTINRVKNNFKESYCMATVSILKNYFLTLDEAQIDVTTFRSFINWALDLLEAATNDDIDKSALVLIAPPKLRKLPKFKVGTTKLIPTTTIIAPSVIMEIPQSNKALNTPTRRPTKSSIILSTTPKSLLDQLLAPYRGRR